MARMVGMHVAACGSMKHHLDVEICFSSDYYSEKGNEISRKASIVVDPKHLAARNVALGK